MTKAQPGRRCVFCGGSPMSREHVLADWIGDAFGINDPQRHWHIAETDAGQRARVYLQRPFRTKVACVCEECNHGWMSRLEEAVKSTLRPMMLSEVSFYLSRDDQRLLAFWAAKTLMVMQCTLPAHERIVPLEHYADLFSNQSAPERCRIAVARRGYESEAWPHRLIQAGAEWRTTPPPGPRPTREEYNAYRAVLGIGHAVFHLLGFYDPQREGNLRPGDLPAGFVEIAPSGGRVLWPPSPEVALTDVERLIRRGPSLIARPKRS